MVATLLLIDLVLGINAKEEEAGQRYLIIKSLEPNGIPILGCSRVARCVVFAHSEPAYLVFPLR